MLEEFQVKYSVWRVAIPRGFHGIPAFPQENCGSVLETSYERFLPHLFPFIIQRPASNSTLHNLNG
jgi:hypothetical protein